MTDGRMELLAEPAVSALQTHVSTLVMAGDRVYKAKRPVDLGFVDFTHRAARQAACHDEVVLNRRIAPDVYLGVGQWCEPDDPQGEPVVVMRRMPAAQRLSRLVGRGVATAAQVRQVARAIGEFHSRCRVIDGHEPLTSAHFHAQLWAEAVSVVAAHPDLVPSGVVRQIDELSRGYLGGRGPLFVQRARAGQVRDGHGDLQAADIYCLPDGPRILDCIEFDESLRCGDVLLDVAFLAMDLDRLGAPTLMRTLLAAYSDYTAEHHPDSLAHFFIAYRAMVRCKVACLDAGGVEASLPGSLAGLALRHLQTARLRLTLVGGLPGAGKSTWAAAAAAKSGAVVLSSDRMRKETAGLIPTQPAPEGLDEGIYSPAWTDLTYARLLERARTLLEHGESVIVDATWSDAAWRRAAGRLARAQSADLREVLVETADETADSRLGSRRADPSDATVAVRHAIAQRFDDWPTATRFVSARGTSPAEGPATARTSAGVAPAAPGAQWRLIEHTTT